MREERGRSRSLCFMFDIKRTNCLGVVYDSEIQFHCLKEKKRKEKKTEMSRSLHLIYKIQRR